MSERLFHICTLINSAGEYAEMRRSFESAGFSTARCRYTVFDNTEGNLHEPYGRINAALAETREPYLVFCHQDVRISAGHGFPDLVRALLQLNELDPSWAVAGNAGGDERQLLVMHLNDPNGSWRSERLPRRVFSLDENFLVLRVGGAARCSPTLSGFHMYGTDVCLNAHLRGGTCYVIDFLVTHMSAGSPWTPSFCLSLDNFCRQWNQQFWLAIVRSTVTEVVLGRSRILRRLARWSFFRRGIVGEQGPILTYFTAAHFRRLVAGAVRSCFSSVRSLRSQNSYGLNKKSATCAFSRGRGALPTAEERGRACLSIGTSGIVRDGERTGSRNVAWDTADRDSGNVLLATVRGPAKTEVSQSSPTVTVVITAYKHRDYIIKSLESVLSQTFSDYEIVVVNDGSPDDTAKLLAPYVGSGSIQYIEQANAGQAAARNRGLAAAKGKYIAFLDDDDVWPPTKLQWQTGMLERNTELIAVGGGVELVDSTGKSIGTVPAKFEEITWARLFSGSPFWSPGQTLIRTQSLRRIGGLNQRIWGADDFDLWFRLAAIGRVVAYADLSLYYRIHEGNASKNALRMFRNTLGVLEKYLSEQPPELRRPSSRNAFRFLYAYAGKQLLRGVRSDLRERRFLAVLSGLKEFSALLLPAVVDPSLSRQIGRDFVLALSKRRKAFGAK